MFLKKSETFISNLFLKKLIQELYKNANEYNEIVNSESLYEMIPSIYKMDGISPLPEKFKFKIKVKNDLIELYKVVGVIPILESPIPDQLPCTECINKRLRYSSDQVSYFLKTEKL